MNKPNAMNKPNKQIISALTLLRCIVNWFYLKVWLISVLKEEKVNILQSTVIGFAG